MTELEIFDCPQGSDEWFLCRAGIPTASRFKDALACTPKGVWPGATATTYMHEIAGEIISGLPMETFSNGYTDRGHRVEGDARDAYAFTHGVSPQAVGFMRRGRAGASPDSLIDDDGQLEIKSKKQSLLIKEALSNRPPPDHLLQVQGQLWISGRQWCDLALYAEGMPLVTYRIERDEEKIAEIASGVDRFNAGVDQLVQQFNERWAA